MRLHFHALLSIAQGFNDEYCGRSELPKYIPPDQGRSVEKVHVFFRHGMRTDIQRHSCFPNNEQPAYTCSLNTEVGVRSSSKGPENARILVKKYSSGCEVGQLLDYAETQMARIADFLRSNYGSRKMILRSTDKTRTLGSIDLLVTHLGDAAPATVHTQEYEEDPLSLNDNSCAMKAYLDSTFRSSTAFKRVTVDSEYFSNCASRWVEEIGTPFDLVQVGDCLVAPQCAEVPLPGGSHASPDLYACVENVFNSVRQLQYNANSTGSWTEGKDYCKLATRSLWGEVLKVSAAQDYSMSLWATHDDVIACLLSSLSLWNGKWPRYASLLVIEELSDGRIRILHEGIPIFETSTWTTLLPEFVFDDNMYRHACEIETEISQSTFADLLLRGVGVSALLNAIVPLR